jgi:GcrA cell cycle regulator
MTETYRPGWDPDHEYVRIKYHWTAEEVVKLRRLLGEGLSASQIGAAFKKTRSAVMGKAFRLGLVVGGGRKDPMSAEERLARKRTAQRKRRDPDGTRSHKKAGGGPSMAGRYKPPRPDWAAYGPPLAVPAGEIWQPLPDVAAVKLLELTDAHCRWPLGEPSEMLYCGATPAGGGPYCGPHCRLAYRPRMSLDGAGRGE